MVLFCKAGLLMGVLVFGVSALAEEAPATENPLPDTSTATAISERLPLDELRIFAQAFSRISEAYVEDIDDKTLLENAIRGMLLQLDPHSAYLDAEAFANLRENTQGSYGGLGVEVSRDDGFIRIITPMDDTPADRAGLRSGDIIVELDGLPVKSLSQEESIDAMRGNPGSSITITYMREGNAKPTEVTIIREIIQVASVRHKSLAPGFGYIRIAQFQTDTGSEVAQAIGKLKADNDALLGLIIDLRNNPGGVLRSAVDVADLFIDDGLIVYTTDRLPNADLRFNATSADTAAGIPLVVLVNEGSASASEIVAGALQDHSRAVIMGVNTFGKGSVQTILPLDETRAIKLTTALYFTPNGRSIQAEGIVPDIWVERSKVTKLDKHPSRLKEKDLPKHLGNGNADQRHSDDAFRHSTKDKTDLVSTDFQLNEALTLLKGLHILAAKPKTLK